ncbi:cupin domain-containing protein [Methylobacillus arboreus]|uniref:cupin domain-containing protein n=1 Tax=Methylobacillus arboreus TaxID=755170 RepID=UPI001E396BFC|nr:cupin domain-containing protein [Methylobacillus arboreus]MCB5190724.1 cupin domain-containing protein [Methylobacillus arboreus]
MTSTTAVKTAQENLKIETGSRNFNPGTWTPFEWDDPIYGKQVKGEVAVIRTQGTSGTLMAGLWRTGPNIAGCEPDGTCHVDYSAPLGDETMVILEGSATVTIKATGKQYRLEAGTIISHPKDVEVCWDIDSPFLKKFWVIWDSPKQATKSDDVFVGNINDNPDVWSAYEWVEPNHGPQVCGELFMLRSTGSTGTLMCGMWRTGVGIAGCEADGSSTVPYTAPLGDETMLLLEGQAHVVNEETGEEYDFKAGDVIALPSGLNITWTSKGPFVKKFWIITSENLPT